MKNLDFGSRLAFLAALLACAVLWTAQPAPAQAAEGMTSVKGSAVAALEYSPRLQVLQNNHDAIYYERRRALGGYYPRIDLALGFGTEAHSDERTRAIGAVNEDDDYDNRSEASLQLTQMLWDGQETRYLVGIETEKLVSAKHRVMDNAESIALDAVIAHLEVYRQRELLALAEKNVKGHEEILAMLEKRKKGGAGSIADVVQAQGRLALTRASVAEVKSNLNQAIANYQRVIGEQPGQVEFSPMPASSRPENLEMALVQARDNNPSVMALGSNVVEARKRVRLSEAAFHPKVNLELSSTYEDQVESSDTYEHNNQAMVRLRWNLLNGAATVADRRASISRKQQSESNKNDRLLQVLEETRATWAQYRAAKEQVVSFGDAVNYNSKTLDAYLKQFKVAQRTLLDVLDARNELFQTSGQLVTATVNEIIAVHRLNALAGNLNESLEIDPAIYQARKPTKM